jgi:hypothetical protein
MGAILATILQKNKKAKINFTWILHSPKPLSGKLIAA